MNTDREHSEQHTKQSRWGFRGMTVRDWLQLLIVPLALVVIGLLFSVQQDARQQRIENQRAEAERELADQRAQDEALQAYLDQMSQLMLERKLLEADQGDPVHTLAQARTSTVILRLDAQHNESVTRFLINSGLALSRDLYARDLYASHSEASARLLSGIALSHATLSDAYLLEADLSDSDLSGADLRSADLSGADLRSADLSDAELLNADLRGADLRGADLINADLSDAFLSAAELSDANLINADLSDAFLSSAQGVSNEELEQQAKTLEGATMPNGQKYEDWLKDR